MGYFRNRAVAREQLGIALLEGFDPADKADAVHTHVAADISDSTTTGRSVLTATDAAAGRTALSAAAATHTHAISDVTSLQTSLDAKAAWNTQTSTTATTYPIGTILLVDTGSENVSRNSTATIYYYNNGNTARFHNNYAGAPAGGALTGTWRSCGAINSTCLFQRVS